MRKIFFSAIFTLLVGLLSWNVSAQILDPVAWEATSKKIGEDTYELIIEATIEKEWHLYSQYVLDDENGPLPTEFEFLEAGKGFEILGETEEPDIEPVFDPVFKTHIKFFSDRAVFTQKIKRTHPDLEFIDAEVLYMVCDDKMCIPDAKSFRVSLKEGVASTQVALEITERDEALTAALALDLKGRDKIENDTDNKSYLTIFLLGFLGGLIALLTPCVFPMIPLTVSFFTKGAKDRKKGLVNAVLYGAFIFIIYLLLSLPFHLLDSVNPEVLNNISTNVALNIVFFIIFMVFAFSFFGYFELTLPSSWSNKMDESATKIGGVVGIFFMALTLAIVSFSCTGPILGSLLGGALTSNGGAIQLTFGMGGFGLALALPFALFALFPNWLNSLPKSGGWLNAVKVVLGFAEVALAFKFLSNADLVEHWGLLKREIFIAIWALCALGAALYLFGFLRFPHDSPKKKRISKGNLITGLLFFAFFIYLIPGLTNTKYANLKLLSGFPPPLFYSLYDKGTEAPLGLKAYKDFEEGVAEAKKQGKPILLDFTGWACVNCRKMEEQVWSRPEIFKVINEDYILISLYVDDRKELEDEQRFNYLRDNNTVKQIRTIGDKWATFQTINFQNNSQPYYVLMDADLTLLTKPVGYTPDSTIFLDWLEEGKKASREMASDLKLDR